MQKISAELSLKLSNMSFICSILVVMIHVWAPQQIGTCAWWIHSLTSVRDIAVPFFFLVSGYFLAAHINELGWWRSETHKRIKTLFVPYILWSVFWFVFWLLRKILFNIGSGDKWSCGIEKIVCSWRIFGLDVFNHPQLPTLWYVRSLLILILLSPLLLVCLRKFPKTVLCLTFIKWIFYWGEEYGTWFYFIDRFLACGFLFFFMLGMALRLNLITGPSQKYKGYGAGFIALILWIVIYGSQTFGKKIGVNLSFDVILILKQFESAFWLYFVWTIMPVKKWPEWLTKMSFAIYLIHWFVVIGVWCPYAGRPPVTVMEYVSSVMFGVIGSILVVCVLRKFMPKLSVILFGGRI